MAREAAPGQGGLEGKGCGCQGRNKFNKRGATFEDKSEVMGRGLQLRRASKGIERFGDRHSTRGESLRGERSETTGKGRGNPGAVHQNDDPNTQGRKGATSSRSTSRWTSLRSCSARPYTRPGPSRRDGTPSALAPPRDLGVGWCGAAEGSSETKTTTFWPTWPSTGCWTRVHPTRPLNPPPATGVRRPPVAGVRSGMR